MPTRVVQRGALAEDVGSVLGRRDLREVLTCWNVANNLTQEFTHASLFVTHRHPRTCVYGKADHEPLLGLEECQAPKREQGEHQATSHHPLPLGCPAQSRGTWECTAQLETAGAAAGQVVGWPQWGQFFRFQEDVEVWIFI